MVLKDQVLTNFLSLTFSKKRKIPFVFLHFIGRRQDNPNALFLSRTPFAIVCVISPLTSVVGAVTFQQAHTESTSTQLLQNFTDLFPKSFNKNPIWACLSPIQ